MTRTLAACLVWTLGACSSGGLGRMDRLTPSGRGEPVTATRGTRALVAPPRQFVAYVPAAGRLSVIDQASEAEVYGIDFSAAVHASLPVGRFDGVAALTDDGLTIFSAGLRRSFAFAYAGGTWDYATEAPAFAFSEGSGIRVVRHLEADAWQEDVLPGIGTEAFAAPVMSADGTALVMIDPNSGAYAIYRADKTSTPMALQLTCAPETSLTSPIVALAMLDSRLFWGDREGRVGMLETNATACQQVTAKGALPTPVDIARLVPRSTGSVLVFGVGGSVYGWDGASSIEPYATLQGCDFALAPVPLADDEIAALCLRDLEAPPDARTVVYDSAAYNYYAKEQSEPQFSLDLTLAEVSALGIDAASKRLFILEGSAMGRLEVVDLATGRSHERRGLFVEKILEP